MFCFILFVTVASFGLKQSLQPETATFADFDMAKYTLTAVFI